MIGDATLQLNHGGDPATGPDLPSEAIRVGPVLQRRGQPGALLGGQPPAGTRWWSGPEGFRSACAAARHPLADGGFADTQGLSDLALRPACLLELPCSQTSCFLPSIR
jgi:hypothetical protein